MKRNEIDIITLGCSKNLVDAERLMRRLELAGYTCVHDSENPQGEMVVINTCGFIGDAKEESIRTILEFVERKRKRKLRHIFVMGCLSERYLADLEAEIPEVDAWVGKFNYMELVEKIKGTAACGTYTDCAPYERVVTTPAHYAYLKISEGCDRMCSYCAIPLITGRHTSRPMEELLDEARWLAEQGVKELNVIAQDLSSYGKDLYGQHMLPELIDRLAQTEGIEWIRLHYAYPTDFPDGLLEVMQKHANVCNYLDIALQHCSDHMLRQMRRHITRQEQDELIRRIRQTVPGICIRTTLLVGHPGETEEDFEELKQWVQTMRFDRMGAFAYSDEDGTYANRHYADDIPQAVKDRRVDEIMQLQQTISGELQQTRVGKTERIVIDRKEGAYWVGRTQYDSPEVDCEVLIEANDKTQHIETGKFYTARIVRAEDFDLFAELC